MSRKALTSIISTVILSALMTAWYIYISKNDILLRNVEALSDNEGYPVLVPCTPAVSICWFLAMDANGQVYNMSVTGLKNAL